jgi:hypothetical protein
MSMDLDEFTFEMIKILLAVAAAVFAYYKFFREGSHRQRIEFDIDCRDLGVVSDDRIVEVGCTAENKGNVEQRFNDIRVTVRGLKTGATLKEIDGHAPRLAFPERMQKASLISKKYGYFFVRPKVKQCFPLVIRVPASWTHIHVRSTFRYKGTEDIHSAERAFQLDQ